ncbi:TPA: hypothetical protein ACQGWB_003257 [Pseudomonas aeruginosa]|uniref:Uncharacterized protein n=1 Tax=Pseudomonas extremaustralis TaxID=359110 RepID=A0AEH8_9PSED|nr:hypothetical protein [Pseudomonas extremaustralis]EZI24058.1 hypothetical protein PE143B_0128705 [Pseudomonas extremaustralis 14-3 substr. 14-3b]TWR99884.1 hypothetical protein FIV36_29070 [Pseudomonas extremaustralis]CAL64822.1 hypothetical protein [Pseudomonas extremaustralis 14-3]SDF56005.1 hypothetical protein SAMN05216591_3310 [Pseudomonas extremaustralis]
MADDDKESSELPGAGEPARKPSGTANLLHNYTNYMAIEEEYDADVASGLLRKSLERKGVEQSQEGVKSWAAISKAMVTSDVDVGQEFTDAKAKTDALVDRMFTSTVKQASSEPELSSSLDARSTPGGDTEEAHMDDDFDDEEVEVEDDELDTLQEIFGTDDEDDASEQAYDHILKMMEKVD